MMHRRFLVPVLVLMVLVAGCRRDEPPAAPAPTGPSQEELDRMRADSIAAARAAAERAAAEERARQEELARQRSIAEARDVLTRRVHFEYDESRITPQAEQVLRQKADILRASPNVRIRMEGHADERGSNEYNLALGNRRAESVLQFFTSFGLDASRFTTVSYGEERPLVTQSNEDAWAQNRRVEFVITAGQDQVNPAR